MKSSKCFSVFPCFRSFWAAFLILSFGFSGYFLVNTFLKWYINPDIGMRKEIFNIRELPFPAITICPQTKTKIEHLSFRETYKTYWENFKLKASDADAAKFESLLHVCEPELSYNIQLNDSKALKGHEIVRILKEISYSTNDSMMFCKFRSELRDCTSLFKEVITSLGVCYSMNMLNYNDIFKYNILNRDLDSQKHNQTSSWSLDNGYQTDDLNAFPYPIISQQHDALRIILKTNDIDMDYVCQGSNQGFKVFFHIPGDCPELSGKHLFVPIKHDVTVSMTAQMTRTSKSLLKYKPLQRKCHLTNERPLKFFKYYTKNLCNIECLANYTMKMCGCVDFSMPREISSKICNYSQRNCSIMAKRNMMLSYNKANPGVYECGCLPSCTEIVYKSDIFHTDFDFKRLFDSYRYDLSDMPGSVLFLN
jgi:acid-sensing ion channel, other